MLVTAGTIAAELPARLDGSEGARPHTNFSPTSSWSGLTRKLRAADHLLVGFGSFFLAGTFYHRTDSGQALNCIVSSDLWRFPRASPGSPCAHRSIGEA